MSRKKIIIVGGGISGLSLLHYLNQKYKTHSNIEITLFEMNSNLGGTIQTQRQDGFLFEEGPNGFLDSKPRTLEFIAELDLNGSLLKAEESANKRFIVDQHKLYEIPNTLLGFLKNPLLNPFQKLRLLAEPLISKKSNPNETVYEFGCRRLGREFTEHFLDAFAVGVFAGDIRKLNLKHAFPRIYQLEDEYGSLFKAMFKLKKKRGGSPKGDLHSFHFGMAEIIKALAMKYSSQIRCGVSVASVSKNNAGFTLETSQGEVQADHVVFATPAYAAAAQLKGLNNYLSQELEKVDYAPVTVVGLGFDIKNQKGVPQGFGYLIPSSEKVKVLGVLFESRVFKNRVDSEDKLFMRVLIGGSRYRDVVKLSSHDAANMAIDEVLWHFPSLAEPMVSFVKSWPKAIPQYDIQYPARLNQIKLELSKFSNLYLHANYLNGISFNDCIENSARLAEQIKIDF
jgi:oxygen-dependent protoporphyrinogen oxidase